MLNEQFAGNQFWFIVEFLLMMKWNVWVKGKMELKVIATRNLTIIRKGKVKCLVQWYFDFEIVMSQLCDCIVYILRHMELQR